MAMFQAHLMLFCLLSLFLLSTSESIIFHYCGDDSDPVIVTDVERYRDQDGESFKIIGSTKELITEGDAEVKVKLGLIKILDEYYNICDLMTCPIASGAPFVLPFAKIFRPVPLVKYNVRLEITDESAKLLLCVTFDFKTSSRIQDQASG